MNPNDSTLYHMAKALFGVLENDASTETWVVGFGDTETTFHGAGVTHVPGPEEPEFLVVTTPSSRHVYRYHDVNYAYRKDD